MCVRACLDFCVCFSQWLLTSGTQRIFIIAYLLISGGIMASVTANVVSWLQVRTLRTTTHIFTHTTAHTFICVHVWLWMSSVATQPAFIFMPVSLPRDMTGCSACFAGCGTLTLSVRRVGHAHTRIHTNTHQTATHPRTHFVCAHAQLSGRCCRPPRPAV